MTKSLTFLICMILMVVTVQLSAREIEVPTDFQTIQAAIDAAQANDVIVVLPGVYLERVQLKPDLILRSKGADEVGVVGLKRAEITILDGGGSDGDVAGVTMAEGATLDGFTVSGMGYFDEELWQRHWNEKGMNQSHEDIGRFSVPAISVSGWGCKVINNVVHHNGHTGIAIQGVDQKECSPLISGNVCYRNMGGGIGSMNGSTAMITDNICFENFHAGIGHHNASPVVTGNDCYNNVRAGIGISNGASPVVRGNRCHGN